MGEYARNKGNDKMTELYTFNIAMDIRAYGSITVEAETETAAGSMLTAELVADKFEPHGSGSDDLDHQHPQRIWVEELDHSLPDGDWINSDPLSGLFTDLKPFTVEDNMDRHNAIVVQSLDNDGQVIDESEECLETDEQRVKLVRRLLADHFARRTTR